MKYLMVYYLLIILPCFVLFELSKTGYFSSKEFVIYFFLYAFVYRTITDYFRLVSKNAIAKKVYWKIFIPGSRIKYFRELYFI